MKRILSLLALFFCANSVFSQTDSAMTTEQIDSIRAHFVNKNRENLIFTHGWGVSSFNKKVSHYSFGVLRPVKDKKEGKLNFFAYGVRYRSVYYLSVESGLPPMKIGTADAIFNFAPYMPYSRLQGSNVNFGIGTAGHRVPNYDTNFLLHLAAEANLEFRLFVFPFVGQDFACRLFGGPAYSYIHTSKNAHGLFFNGNIPSDNNWSFHVGTAVAWFSR